MPPPDRRPAARTSLEAHADADAPLDAGAFGAWLDGMAGALAGGRESDVPCGGCTGCCTSSQFVHVGPDEVDTLARIVRGVTLSIVNQEYILASKAAGAGWLLGVCLAAAGR